MDPDVNTVALSSPRGNGKSTLCAWLARRTLTPGDPLFEAGVENYMAAASVGQSRRTTFKILRRMLEAKGGDDYRLAESHVGCHAVHVPTSTRLSVMASSAKTAQGIVDARFIIADEPGSWEVAGGQAMHEAIQTSQGKPLSRVKAIYVGTVAPSSGGGWWGRMLGEGDTGSTRVHLFQATEDDLERWDAWPVIARCNPLMWRFAESRRKLLEERDAARRDSRKKASFISYRLNVPTQDRLSVVLTVETWKKILKRIPLPRVGRPIIGVDLGQGRAWSSAVAIWPGARVEAVAIAPGVPNISDQEKRDQVVPGTYQRLVDSGQLMVAEGLHVPPVGMLIDLVRDWRPRAITCDRFRLADLRDTSPPCPVLPRVSRWSESTQDITALRRLALDGNMTVAMGSRAVLQHSLKVSRTKTDDSGNTRLTKSRNNTARDDVTAGLILAAGLHSRLPARVNRPKFAVVG